MFKRVIQASGCSAVWLARQTGGLKVESSSLSIPTISFQQFIQIFIFPPCLTVPYKIDLYKLISGLTSVSVHCMIFQDSNSKSMRLRIT